MITCKQWKFVVYQCLKSVCFTLTLSNVARADHHKLHQLLDVFAKEFFLDSFSVVWCLFRSCSMWQESTSATVPNLESPQVMGNAMQELSKLQHPLHYGVCFSFQTLSLLSSCGASWRQWYSRHGIKMWHSTDCVSIHVWPVILGR